MHCSEQAGTAYCYNALEYTRNCFQDDKAGAEGRRSSRQRGTSYAGSLPVSAIQVDNPLLIHLLKCPCENSSKRPDAVRKDKDEVWDDATMAYAGFIPLRPGSDSFASSRLELIQSFLSVFCRLSPRLHRLRASESIAHPLPSFLPMKTPPTVVFK